MRSTRITPCEGYSLVLRQRTSLPWLPLARDAVFRTSVKTRTNLARVNRNRITARKNGQGYGILISIVA